MDRHRSPKRQKPYGRLQPASKLSGPSFAAFKAWMLKSTAAKRSLNLFLPLLLLVGLCVWMSFYKINGPRSLAFFSSDGEGFYWTEAAFHFRHARMIARGSPIPALDVDIQYPEGLDTSRYITPVMERVCGGLYRLLGLTMPLHIFLIYFMSVFSTFSVVALFLAAKFLWRSNWAALVSAVFYCIAPASFIRSAAGSFIREDFALPFIFLSFAFFIFCLRKDNAFVAAVASLLFAVALAAWHLTQFYLLLFVVGLVIVFFLQKTALPRLSFTIFTAVTVITSVALPVLRAKYVVCSFALMLSYAVLVLLWLAPRRVLDSRIRRFMWGGTVVFVFLALGLLIQKQFGGYSYMYDFVLTKFRYLGRLPQDCSVLPFETKVTWTSSFVRPTLKEVCFLLSVTLLFGPAMIFRSIVRILKGSARAPETIVVYLAVCSFLLFVVIHRLSVFAVFFLAIPIGGIVFVKGHFLRPLSASAVAACLVFAVYSFANLRLIPFRPPQQPLTDIISFIKTSTGPDEAVLSSFQLGPSVAAYGNRPVILHPKFESKIVRDKVEAVYTALYRSEKDFYQLCKRYGASLFVYQSDMVLASGPGSIRYMAAADRLKKDSAAAMFHFAPEKLRHFRLLHQNFAYRIFGVGENLPEQAADIQYEPVYDISVYCRADSLGDYIDDSIIESGVARLREPATHKMLGDAFLSVADFYTAVLQYQRALTIDPSYGEAAWCLGKALYRSDNPQYALAVLARAFGVDETLDVNFTDIPDSQVWLAIGINELAERRFERAERLFKKLLARQPELCEAQLGLGTTLFRLNRVQQAEQVLKLAVSCDPNSSRAYEVLGKFYASYGDYEKALQAVEKSLSLNPQQEHLLEVRRALKGVVPEKRDVLQPGD